MLLFVPRLKKYSLRIGKKLKILIKNNDLVKTGIVAVMMASGFVSPTLAEEGFTSSLIDRAQSKYHPEGEQEIVDGSIVPELAMEEQIAPCLAQDDNITRVLVSVSGVQSDQGNVRVVIYGDNPEDFLVSGKGVSKVDIPSQTGEVQLCLELPQAGEYSMAVLHDENANGHADIMSEGFGFSNNPGLGFSVPDYEEVSFQTQLGVQEIKVDLNYIFGSAQVDRRRRTRR